jgi:hypothetical protein
LLIIDSQQLGRFVKKAKRDLIVVLILFNPTDRVVVVLLGCFFFAQLPTCYMVGKRNGDFSWLVFLFVSPVASALKSAILRSSESPPSVASGGRQSFSSTCRTRAPDKHRYCHLLPLAVASLGTCVLGINETCSESISRRLLRN